MIDLEEIVPGDILTVQDGMKNVIVAPVSVGGEQLQVEAFNTWIQIARRNRMGRLVALPHIKIVGHQARLPGEGLW